jgi:hypothetical protein
MFSSHMNFTLNHKTAHAENDFSGSPSKANYFIFTKSHIWPVIVIYAPQH